MSQENISPEPLIYTTRAMHTIPPHRIRGNVIQGKCGSCGVRVLYDGDQYAKTESLALRFGCRGMLILCISCAESRAKERVQREDYGGDMLVGPDDHAITTNGSKETLAFWAKLKKINEPAAEKLPCQHCGMETEFLRKVCTICELPFQEEDEGGER